MPEEAFEWSSIGLLEAMATTDRVAYCPSVFSFNTYAQPPAAGRHILRYGDMPGSNGPGQVRAVLGGTGLAVSALSDHIPEAVSAALHFVGKGAQLRMAEWGGQPAHRSVWEPDAAATRNGSFFDDCRAVQTGACIRPRWPGYIALQNEAGRLLRDDLAQQHRAMSRVVDEIEEAFRAARTRGAAAA
ncbi:hypothetical protein GQ651_06295 [Alphaproteobacteria bacterium GH1-50]|uniref:Extracellular solute-binding protein n=1 Tax=Kangsaoukella pontilimi TaxID=2691042 RepID=A0A7C9MW93_9RHOB|nr:hypothetical protein [Kangsaoukella pontilimi]